mgnify:CR=1 FL=1
MANEYGFPVVNGPALIKVKLGNNAPMELGISIGEGGVEILPQVDYNPIPSDVAGTRPADKQITGIGYVINVRMAYTKKATIAALLKFYGTAEGLMATYGKPLLANNLMMELGITGELDEPHHFAPPVHVHRRSARWQSGDNLRGQGV